MKYLWAETRSGFEPPDYKKSYLYSYVVCELEIDLVFSVVLLQS